MVTSPCPFHPSYCLAWSRHRAHSIHHTTCVSSTSATSLAAGIDTEDTAHMHHTCLWLEGVRRSLPPPPLSMAPPAGGHIPPPLCSHSPSSMHHRCFPVPFSFLFMCFSLLVMPLKPLRKSFSGRCSAYFKTHVATRCPSRWAGPHDHGT